MAETTPKPKCADCGVDIEGDPETCAKCGFDLHAFKSFFRLFKAAGKKMTEEEAEAAAKAKVNQKPPSVMDTILGKKKAKA